MFFSSTRGFVFLVCLGLLFTGCDSKKKKQAVRNKQLPPANRSKDYRAKSSANISVSAKEANAFAAQWAGAIRTGQQPQISKLVDWEGIVKRTIDSLGVTDAKQKKSMLEGGKEISNNITKSLKTSFGVKGTYLLVRIAERGGDRHAVFRVLGEDGALNYHDLRLVKKNGTVVADQFFVASTGEEMSDTFRNVLMPLVRNEKTVMGRLTGGAKNALADLEKTQQMSLAVRSGENKRALRIYHSMSAEAQKSKLAMLTRLMATVGESEDDYLVAVEEYSRLFPNDASLGLMTLDAATIRKDYQMLERSRQQINAWTGGDPYIDLLVAAVLASGGKTEKAIEISKSIDPATIVSSSAHDLKMTIALFTKDHAETLRQLKLLRSVYSYDFLDLRKAPDYKAFTESKEFQEWLKVIGETKERK